MKNCVYFTIVAMLSQHCVLKLNAVHGQATSDAWDTKTYNPVNYNSGYLQHQEQHQQLTNGFQSQQQLSAQYEYPTEQPFIASGETWYSNYGSLESSNNILPPLQYPYPNQYVNEQQQVQQHNSVNPTSTQSNPQYPGIQQQHQNSQVHLNGYAYEGNQYQYQDGTEQLQDQYATAYNAPQQYPYANEPPAMIGGHGQEMHESHSSERYAGTDVSVPTIDSSQQEQQHHEGDYYTKTQYPTENAEYATRTTPPTPLSQKKTNGDLQRKRIHESTIIPPAEAHDLNTQRANPTDCSKILNAADTATRLGSLENFCHQNGPGTYPHPYECTKFIFCHNGRQSELDCPLRTDFNGTQLTCDHKHNVQCSEQWVGGSKQSTGIPCLNARNNQFAPLQDMLDKQPYEIKCPPDVRGIFPYPFGNRQYVKCIDGQLLIKPCRRGLMFSLSRKLCDIKEYLQTYDTAVPVHLSEVQNSVNGEMEYQPIRKDIKTQNLTFLECPPRVSGKFIYPFLDTSYVQCLNGVTEIETCMNDAIYSIRAKKCLPRHQVDANDHVEGIGRYMEAYSKDYKSLGVICGPETEGRYAHPEDWRKFLICRHGVVTVKKCRGDKIFDIKSKRCIVKTN